MARAVPTSRWFQRTNTVPMTLDVAAAKRALPGERSVRMKVSAPCATRVRVKIRRNGELRGTPNVRVMRSTGEQLGVMTLAEGLRLAMKEGLDLVEVNPKAAPPLCKLLDFSKYRYSAR